MENPGGPEPLPHAAAMQPQSIWTVIYALRSHFGQFFAYGFNQIKPSLSAFLLPKSGWKMVLWDNCFGRRYRDFSHSKTHPCRLALNGVKMEKKQTQLLFFALLVPFWIWGVCTGVFVFYQSAPQMSMKCPREFSSVTTSYPQRGLTFRMFLFNLPLVPSLFWLSTYYSF